ncbi:uncharacterized protein [Chelonus insularis]|uniref:uncharacterized protein n=1 Tax=Chelonus insularis TaxID=460826 RepID=UPI00158C2EB8|nr:uncharacterized protein LOC118066205 [Chelonus insularis]
MMLFKRLLFINLCLLFIAALISAKPTGDSSDISADFDDDYEDKDTELQRDQPYNTQIEPFVPSQDCSGPGKVSIHVACLPQSIEIRVDQEGTDDTLLYVEGHRDDPECKKTFPSITNSFQVNFGKCGVELIGNKARYNLMVLRHNVIDNGDSNIHDITCYYPSKNGTAAKKLIVDRAPSSRQSTNTSIMVPDPTHKMYITTLDGTPVENAKPGDKLVAIISIHPKLYKATVKNCEVKSNDESHPDHYLVTDEHGCATDVQNFGQWEWHDESHSLQANFKAFKFPDNGNIMITCDVNYCYDKCEPLNCPNDRPCWLKEQRN